MHMSCAHCDFYQFIWVLRTVSSRDASIFPYLHDYVSFPSSILFEHGSSHTKNEVCQSQSEDSLHKQSIFVVVIVTTLAPKSSSFWYICYNFAQTCHLCCTDMESGPTYLCGTDDDNLGAEAYSCTDYDNFGAKV